jgi:SWI/SNF-related matrix-associated actin-dependent regulator of chromatin subfamily A3
MGLGKTLTMISLICETKNAAHESVKSVASSDSSDVELVVQDLDMTMPKMTSSLALRKILAHPIFQFDKRSSFATLIVAPVSLLEHWKKQFESHCSKSSIKLLIYHAISRSEITVNDMLKYDVILTTYNIVASEFSKALQETRANKNFFEKRCPLHMIDWYRIVLVGINFNIVCL